MKAFALTDVGQKRKINQDSVFASAGPVGNLPNLFIVADGMGGHNAGDFASRYAVNTVREAIAASREQNPVKLIREAIELANQGILDEAARHEEMRGMGTTIVVTTVIGNFAYTANVGDSRLYLYDGELRQITKDHSLVEEMVRDAKKVVILNPEDKNKWDIVDSCVSLYRDAGAHVFEVNTLNQLARFVEQM